MEISARVLREVEFNSSLRGYNTDEVDEFLEQVADGVDRLQGEAKAAAERAETAERTAQDRSGLDDDDSIRRTLVLAQRTADLAVREAQEEAGQILDRARAEAETLVSDARDSAGRITSEAERRLQEEVTRLTSSRDGLRTEVDTLLSLLGAERERLTETLSAALRYVERSLSPSGPLMSLQVATASREVAGPGGTSAEAPAEGESGDAGPESGDAGPENDDAGAENDDAGAENDDADGGSSTETYAVVTPQEKGPVPGAPAPARVAAGGDSDSTTDAGSSEAVEVDELEAGIAADAAAAAPDSRVRRNEPEADHYDWDSVIGGRTEPSIGDPPHGERANLTALPPLDERSDAAAQMRVRSTDWSA